MRTRGSDAPTAIDKLSPRSLISDSSSLAMFSTNGPQHERFGMHLESAGGDLGDVEHLIDEMSQMRRRRGDAVHRRHLTRRQIAVHAVLQQLDEADDGVERRAQLVRDVREKLALRRVGARNFAVQSLELSRTLGDANRLAPLAEQAKAEERDRRETQRPEQRAARIDAAVVRDDQRQTLVHWRRVAHRDKRLAAVATIARGERRRIAGDDRRCRDRRDRRGAPRLRSE